MYSPQVVVGEFFEERLMRIFNMLRSDSHMQGEEPDLAAKDGSYYFEVKASAYNNGGVIKGSQLFRFDKEISVRRFYVFAYHSLTEKLTKIYPTKRDLKKALDIRSIYVFPFSIVKAHYKNSKRKLYGEHDDFVQLKEVEAQVAYDKDEGFWKHLGLNPDEYVQCKLHEKVFLVTREGHLEDKIRQNFNARFVR